MTRLRSWLRATMPLLRVGAWAGTGLVGVAMLVSGVALFSLGAALIAGGLFMMAGALLAVLGPKRERRAES